MTEPDQYLMPPEGTPTARGCLELGKYNSSKIIP